MKKHAIKDPVRQYKRMMSLSKKLKDRLEKIMEVIPPCVSYSGTPITFDIDKFIVSLTGKGFPADRIDKQVVEKGYICTVLTAAGLQIVLRHDRNWKRHVHIMINDQDSIISNCDESLIAEVVIAVDSLGEEYRQEYGKIKRFFEELHTTTVDDIRSAYHARLVSDDPAFRISAVERLIDEVLDKLSESGTHEGAQIVSRNAHNSTWIEYAISYRGSCIKLRFWHTNEMFFEVDADNKYVFKDIESSLSLEFLYSSPEEIATFIKRMYEYVEHIEYKKAHNDLGWRPILKGSLECLCTYGLWHDISPELHNHLVKKFETILNMEMAQYLKVLTDFEYNGKVHISDKLPNWESGHCEGKGYDARVVINDSIYQSMHPDEIRLVLLHELCHTKHTAHGRTFFMTLEDMLLRVGLLTEEEKIVQFFYPKHRGIIDFESLPLRKYRGSF